eukprot:1159831-Pelagomonas_calceolata.AAC.1
MLGFPLLPYSLTILKGKIGAGQTQCNPSSQTDAHALTICLLCQPVVFGAYEMSMSKCMHKPGAAQSSGTPTAASSRSCRFNTEAAYLSHLKRSSIPDTAEYLSRFKQRYFAYLRHAPNEAVAPNASSSSFLGGANPSIGPPIHIPWSSSLARLPEVHKTHKGVVYKVKIDWQLRKDGDGCSDEMLLLVYTPGMIISRAHNS